MGDAARPIIKIKLKNAPSLNTEHSQSQDHGPLASAPYHITPNNHSEYLTDHSNVAALPPVPSSSAIASKPIKLTIKAPVSSPQQHLKRQGEFNDFENKKRPKPHVSAFPGAAAPPVTKIKLKPSSGNLLGAPSMDAANFMTQPAAPLPIIRLSVPTQTFPRKRRGRPKGIKNGERARREANEEVHYLLNEPLPLRKHSIRAVQQNAPGDEPELGVPQKVTLPESIVPQKAPRPPRRNDFDKILAKILRRDTSGLFKEPVTEDVAPGYFDKITQPMDLATMRKKNEDGAYVTWDDVWLDLDLMFNNALKYNEENGDILRYATALYDHARMIVEAARQGKTDFRSTAGATRKLNQQLRAEQRAQRDAARQMAKAEQRAAQEAKVLRKAGVHVDDHDENQPRYTFMTRVAEVQELKSLGAGATAEGVSFTWNRQLLALGKPQQHSSSYIGSLARYTARLMMGKLRSLVESRVNKAKLAAARPPPPLPVEQVSDKLPPPGPLFQNSGMPPVPTLASFSAPMMPYTHIMPPGMVQPPRAVGQGFLAAGMPTTTTQPFSWAALPLGQFPAHLARKE